MIRLIVRCFSSNTHAYFLTITSFLLKIIHYIHFFHVSSFLKWNNNTKGQTALYLLKDFTLTPKKREQLGSPEAFDSHVACTQTHTEELTDCTRWNERNREMRRWHTPALVQNEREGRAHARLLCMHLKRGRGP